MEQDKSCNVLVIWRGRQFNVNINSSSKVKEFGQMLQDLTNVRPDTIKLFVPQSNSKGSKLLSPFSDAHSKLSLQEASILEGKTIKMMGVFSDEIDEVSQSAKRSDLRIAGFAEEEQRLKQRQTYKPQSSLKLPQGPYIFCEFCTLQIPGIKLTPPPSEALRRMHMLACDPGIIAIMNKHRWRVGIMTEMAPEGYVGISPKCILGFNKNFGEEISLRLRTDDLKGFRKYESIKKTLLHELAHMVHSEHDSSFFALNKQLNEEAARLDWTKSTSNTLSGHKFPVHYEEEDYVEGSSEITGQELGGAKNSLASARASSVAAAYNRRVNASSFDEMPVADRKSGIHDSKLMDNQGSFSAQSDADDVMTAEQDAMHHDVVDIRVSTSKSSILDALDEPDPDDSLNNDKRIEPDPDDPLHNVNMLEPDPDDSQARDIPVTEHEPDPDDSQARDIPVTEHEPDPDDDTLADVAAKSIKKPDSIGRRPKMTSTSRQRDVEPNPDDTLKNDVIDGTMEEMNLGKRYEELDPDDSAKDKSSEAYERLQQSDKSSLATEDLTGDHDDGMHSQQLQSIEEPAAIFCSRLQRAIDSLRLEATSSQSISALQTLFKIIRNVMEHPDEIRFRRLRKANPQFQRNVANFKAAMEVLTLVGFCEDVIADEIGRAETFLVLKRNDPGLLWLAKSSPELFIA